MNEKFQIDTKEIDLPDTLFVRDIETRVFQTIALQTLSTIEGVSMLEGGLIDSFLGRDGTDSVKGIYVDQDQKNKAVKIKLEINIAYGISLPEKAEEIQGKIAQEISRLTGLHVSCVHVIFRNLVLPHEKQLEGPPEEAPIVEEVAQYSEDFE
ncbi:MAG: Asp23/Gls24 family envelope stress response protein [Simkaniaceae bacterium]|nr:Asp23/Gls24 family envelope stress response protein [Candidatus Sacchlamyda saccharinae]